MTLKELQDLIAKEFPHRDVTVSIHTSRMRCGLSWNGFDAHYDGKCTVSLKTLEHALAWLREQKRLDGLPADDVNDADFTIEEETTTDADHSNRNTGLEGTEQAG